MQEPIWAVLLEVEVIGFLSDILSSQAFAEVTTAIAVATSCSTGQCPDARH
jgi:hypothetical protein